MLLLKRISAWDYLSDFCNSHWDELGGLIRVIVDHGLQDSLDNIVANEFPNGVEDDELQRFFLDERDFILKELGYTGV